jgi:hypothetical protein
VECVDRGRSDKAELGILSKKQNIRTLGKKRWLPEPYIQVDWGADMLVQAGK